MSTPATPIPSSSTSASAPATAPSAVHHHTDLLPRLASPEGEVQLKGLRELKNRIMGNCTKKLSFINLGLVPAVADILAAPRADDRNVGLIMLYIKSLMQEM